MSRGPEDHVPGLVVGAVAGVLFMGLVTMCGARHGSAACRSCDEAPPDAPRAAFEACAVECRDAEIGMRLGRVDLRHHATGGGFTCVCERSEL